MAAQIVIPLVIKDDGSVTLGKIEGGLARVEDSAKKASKSINDALSQSFGDKLAAGFTGLSEMLTMDVGTATLGVLAATAVAAGTAVVGATAHFVAASAAIVDIADRSGLGVEALQALRFAAEQSGTSLETVVGASRKLRTEIAEGSTATVDLLDGLGLSLASLKSVTPDQQLATVAERIAQIEDPAARTYAAVKLLGASGEELVPLGGQLGDLAQRARDLGVVMSESDVRAAAALGNEVSALRSAFGGLVDNVGAVLATNASLHELVQGLTGVLSVLSEEVHGNRSALQELASGGVVVVARGLLMLETAVSAGMDTWDGLKLMWMALKHLGLELALVAEKAMLALEKAMPGNSPEQQKSIALAEANVRALEAEIAANSEAANKVVEGSSRRADALARIRKGLEDVEKAVAGAAGKEVQLGAATGRTTRTIDTQAEAARKAGEAMGRLRQELDKALAAAEASRAGGLAGTFQGLEQQHKEWVRKVAEGEKEANKPGLSRPRSQALHEEARQLREEVERLTKAQRDNAVEAARQSVLGETLADISKKAQEVVDVYDEWASRGHTVAELTSASLNDLISKLSEYSEKVKLSTKQTELLGEARAELSSRGLVPDKDIEKASEAMSGLRQELDRALASAAASQAGGLAGTFQELEQKHKEFLRKVAEAEKEADKPDTSPSKSKAIHAEAQQFREEIEKLTKAQRESVVEAARQSVLGQTLADVSKKAQEVVNVYGEWASRGHTLAELSSADLNKLVGELQGYKRELEDSGREVALTAEQTALLNQAQAELSHRGVLAMVKWREALEDVDHVFNVLGISADSAMGRILGGITAAGAGLESLFKDRGTLDAIQGGGGLMKTASAVVAGVSQAFVVGGAALAVGKAVFSLFSESPAEKAARIGGQLLGRKVSEGLAEEIAKTAESLNVDFKAATLLNLDRAIDEARVTTAEFDDQIGLLFAGISSGSVPAAEGVDQLGKLWGRAGEEARRAGKTFNATTVGMLQAARQLGIEFPGMADAVRAGIEKAAGGFDSIIAEFTESKKGTDAKLVSGLLFGGSEKATFEEMAAGARAQATLYTATFWETVGQQGQVAAADAFKDTFTRFKENLSTALTPEEINQLIGPMDRLMTLINEPGEGEAGSKFRAALEAAAGAKDVVEGLSEAGVMSQERLAAAGTIAADAYRQAFEASLAHGSTQEQAQLDALQGVQPLLQTLLDSAAAYGLQLDANSQALVQQAEAAGLAFKTDPMMQMVDILRAIAAALGAEIPASAQAAGTSFSALAGVSTSAGQQAADAWTRTSKTIPDDVAVAWLGARAHFEELGAFGSLQAEYVGTQWAGEIGELPIHILQAIDPTAAAFQALADGSLEPLSRVRTAVGGIVSRLEDIPGAAAGATGALAGLHRPGGGSAPRPGREPREPVGHATGAISTAPHLAMIHGTPRNPEIVAPLSALLREVGRGAVDSARGADARPGRVELGPVSYNPTIVLPQGTGLTEDQLYRMSLRLVKNNVRGFRTMLKQAIEGTL